MILFILYCIYIFNIFSLGYGNIILAIVLQIIYFIYVVFCFLFLFNDFFDELMGFPKNYKYLVRQLILSFTCLFALVYIIYCIYNRLKLENILDIKWINTIINNFKNIKLLDAVSKIQNSIFKILENISKLPKNEWFKGIVITIIGGTASTIIATLILDKHKKSKNSNDKNANGENINNNKKT